jgi:hypothetical protein
MNADYLAATMSALEAATDALLVALAHRPDADLEGAAAALRAREAALRLLVRSDATSRPPDMNARLRRVLERDGEAADKLRAEMESLRARLANTRQVMNTYRSPARAAGSARAGG